MHFDLGQGDPEDLKRSYDLKLLKKILLFVAPYGKLLFLSVLPVVVITCLELLLPWLTKIAIDRHIVPTAHVSSPTGDSGEPVRYYKVDGTAADVEYLVKKYEPLFIKAETEGDSEIRWIKFTDLAKLEPEDLRRARAGDLAGVGRIVLLYLGLSIVIFVMQFAQNMITEMSGQKIMHDIRMRLFSRIQSFSLDFFTKRPVASLVTVTANHVQNMHEFFTSVIALIFIDIFLMIGIAVILLLINLKLALICLAIMAAVAPVSFGFANRTRDAYRVLRIKTAEINAKFSETIEGMKILQLFGMERGNFASFGKTNLENYDAGMRQLRAFSLFMPVIEMLGIITVAVIVYRGGGYVLDGTLSIGGLVAFLFYMKMFYRPIKDVAEKYNIIQDALSSAERIMLMLEREDAIPRKPGAGEGVLASGMREIAFEKVGFSYNPGEPVLKGISFSMKTGQRIAVMGPTGAGKTSLINLLLGFYRPDSGRILINGVELGDIPVSELRSKIAFVPQTSFIFSGTVRSNIVGNGNVSHRELDAVIEASMCGSLLERLDRGLDTEMAEGGKLLSSGERQLLSIARAFALKPELIVFDEATSHIDSATEERLKKAMENLTVQRTSIIIAHRLSTARDADRILVLNGGVIAEEGDHESLMKAGGFYAGFQAHEFCGRL